METLFNSAFSDHDPYEGMTKKQIRKAEASRLRMLRSFDRLDAYILSCPTKVKNYIDKHPLLQKSTEFFADRVRLDKEVLGHVFKQECQVTIRGYQFQKRMEAAAKMLQAGRMSPKRVASRCGYSNINNFSRAFKKVYKKTPTQYLEKQQSRR